MSTIKDLLKMLEGAKNIALITHKNPDADAIGSCLAIKSYLQSLTKDFHQTIDIFTEYDEETVYPILKPLIESNHVNIQNASTYNIAISLDCADTSRFSKFEEIFKTASVNINIDHHATNTNYGNINIVSPNSSSACELVYYLLMLNKRTIPQDTAKYAFMGIITDTVNLSQNNSSPRTFSVLADIASYKFDMDEIRNQFFKNESKAKKILTQKALSSLRFYDHDRIAIMKLKNSDLVDLQATDEDTVGIVEQANNMRGVEISALIIEKEPQKFYVSLRSKGEIKVSTLATQLGGGGHDHMAAYQVEGDVKEITQNLVSAAINMLPAYKDEEENFCL